MKKTESWRGMVGPFEKWRADPLMFFFSFLLIIVVYMLKRLKWLSWQVLSVVTFKTWVRIPGLYNLQYYFSLTNLMQRLKSRPPYAIIIPVHAWPSETIQRCIIDEHPKPWSMCHKMLGKVNKFQRQMGQIAESIPPCWDRKPPGLLSLFFLFHF